MKSFLFLKINIFYFLFFLLTMSVVIICDKWQSCEEGGNDKW